MRGPAEGAGGASPVLVVPSVETGRGGGHLARCVVLVRDLRALGREAYLFLPAPLRHSAAPGIPVALETLAPLVAELESPWVLGNAAAMTWGFIVLDCFQTPEAAYRFWASLAFLVGIDEGGPRRDRFDFLIDLLPGPPGRHPPNFLDPGLLPLPKHVRTQPPAESGPLKVLISFGAEDRARLGPLSAASLKGAAGFDITLIDPHYPQDPQGEDAHDAGQNPRGPAPESPGGLTVLRTIPGLGEHLADYDLLITHFGLTAFEALHAGTPVLLVSPGPYHERLAGAAGFLSAGIGRRGARRLNTLLAADSPGAGPRRRLETLRRRGRALARRYGVTGRERDRPGLADFLAALEPQGPGRRCPGCGDTVDSAGGPTHPVLARFPDRLFLRCKQCGLIYMNRIREPPIEYGDTYFFESYQKQYGKTYIEDFPNLMAMGRRRLSHIRPLLARNRAADGPPAGGPEKLLDIGCAYGPFLMAAAQEGFEVCGIDPAEGAVRYVQDTLKLPALRGFFPSPAEDGNDGGASRFPPASFSVVTLWYVIEHLVNLAEALAEANRLLREGGVLAFSTPSGSGISGRVSLGAFLEKSPADHWTIWSPRITRGLLKRHGFTLKKIVSTGHHPERFPRIGTWCRSKRGPLYRLLLMFSRIRGLGDTFEVYACKDPAPPKKEEKYEA